MKLRLILRQCLTLVGVWVFAPPLWAQTTDTLMLEASFPAVASYLTTDRLNQIYAVDEQQRLIKYSSNGEVQFEYSNRTLGQLGLVDAKDPFNILLFFPDYQQLVFLDRTLNPVSELRLPLEQFPGVSLVGMARDNRLWVYDALRFRLFQLGPQGEILREGPDLTQLFGRNAPQPTQLAITDESLYLLDPQRGLYRFDWYGNFQTHLADPTIQQLQAVDHLLAYQRADGLFLRNELGLERILPALPGGMRGWSMQLRQLVVLRADRIERWRLSR